MRIQTFSILAGSEACNARCPFCISKMTPPHGIELKESEVNWRNFRIACHFAAKAGATTVMFTGKGEPTLFPEQITKYLHELEPFGFPFIELQTNGIKIFEETEKYAPHLKEWYRLGMTLIAVSIVHYEPEPNRLTYLPHKKAYIDLPALAKIIRGHGFSMRFTCILAKNFIDRPESLERLIEFAKANSVEQLTITPVNKPDDDSHHPEAWDWTNRHHLSEEELGSIKEYLYARGTPLMRLAHGAVVFDLGGQNVCLNNCLSIQPDSEDLRNLIFFPDGHLRYYWQYPGAILL